MLRPLGDRVVLKQLEAEEKTASGIVLPTKSQEKPQEAEVVAVGPGGIVEGKEIKMEVKIGDKVLYAKYSGTEVKVGEERYIIVSQNEILAVVEWHIYTVIASIFSRSNLVLSLGRVMKKVRFKREIASFFAMTHLGK